MARLGELLVAGGMLTAEQVEQALRAQVIWGGRFGTNVVELGFTDLDKVAVALGRQHRMPPALGRHFERANPEIQRKLSPDVAEKFSCVPLLLAGPERTQLIVASTKPLTPKAIAIIADEIGVDPTGIIQSVAAELRIHYHLERVYQIPRETRFLRAKGKTIPNFPTFDLDPMAFEDSQVDHPTPPGQPKVEIEIEVDDSELIEEARGELRARLESKAAQKEEAAREEAPTVQMPVLEDVEEVQDLEALAILDENPVAIPEPVTREDSTGRERRRYVQTLDATPRSIASAAGQTGASAAGQTGAAQQAQKVPTEPSLARIQIKKLSVPVPAVVDEEPTGMGMTLGEATRAIRRSTDRDRVADLVCETLFRFMQSCDAAQLLILRGEAALAWKGFSRAGGSLPEIAVPLDQPGLIPRVIERNATCRMPSADLGPIDQLLLVSLGAQSGDLVIVPVSISNAVICVIALAAHRDAQVHTAESVAAAAGAAFARLMRNASR